MKKKLTIIPKRSNDLVISSKFVRNSNGRILRNFRLLKESFYRTDYLRNQPLARFIYILNTS